MAAIQDVEEDQQTATLVAVSNKSPTNVKLDRWTNWLGIPSDGSFPKTILTNTETTFIHMPAIEGSKAMFQYSESSMTGSSVILAWEAPKTYDLSQSCNKVYVIGGPKSVLDDISLEEILTDLSAATSTCSSYGIEATIEHIYNNNNKVDLYVTINFN